MPHRTLLALALAGALPLAGCVTVTPADRPAAGRCNAEPGQSLIGQKASEETGRRALALTGATTLRWGAPGAVFTMDYREDRVNVLHDAALTITGIRCG